MTTRGWSIIIAILCAVIAVLAWFLFATPQRPVDQSVGSSTSTTPETPPNDESTAVPASLAARVQVSSPKKNDIVATSFTVGGQAPGPWFFEASFPIKVLDKDGTVIGTGHGEAQGEWMTDQDVAFFAHVTTSGYTGAATLVLMKDNPSGLPEYDESVAIPITIK